MIPPVSNQADVQEGASGPLSRRESALREDQGSGGAVAGNAWTAEQAAAAAKQAASSAAGRNAGRDDEGEEEEEEDNRNDNGCLARILQDEQGANEGCWVVEATVVALQVRWPAGSC